MQLLHCPGLPRSLNVDMEWLYGASESSSMEVDIGYIPQVSPQQHPAPGPPYPHLSHE